MKVVLCLCGAGLARRVRVVCVQVEGLSVHVFPVSVGELAVFDVPRGGTVTFQHHLRLVNWGWFPVRLW